MKVKASPANCLSNAGREHSSLFFTDPAKMVQWIGRHVLLEPKIGGPFRIDINGEHIAVGEYVELVPCEKLVLTWGWTHSQIMPPGSSTVEFRLYPEANGTRLVLTHSGLPAAGMPSQLQGWLHYTSRLQAVAQGRDPGPDPYTTPPGR
jgi:uncharacterized protein YndB with AHSA1/START domain